MTRRGDQTRERLVEAAADVVAEVGYARATTRAIARAAGVAEGTIYRHFPDKQRLFHAAVLHRNQPLLDWMAKLPALAGTATVAENLSATLSQLGRLRRELLPLELAVMSDPSLAAASARARPQDHLEGPPALLAAYLAEEQRIGRVRDDLDVRQAAVTVLAMLFGLAMLPPDDDGFPPADAVASSVQLVVRGLQPLA